MLEFLYTIDWVTGKLFTGWTALMSLYHKHLSTVNINLIP